MAHLRAVHYERHQPERTLLYQVVQKHYPIFRAQLEDEGRPLPGCVQREFEASALLVDTLLPEQPIRQWGLSVPYPLRFLFASQPKVMGKVLGIVYRTIARHSSYKR